MALLLELFAFFAVWLLFTFAASSDELAAGAVTAALATLAARMARKADAHGIVLKLRWLPAIPALLTAVSADGWRLLRALVRDKIVDSRMRSGAFDPGGDDPESVTRRALAVIFSTMTPNTIVLDVDRSTQRIVYHELVPGGRRVPPRRLAES